VTCNTGVGGLTVSVATRVVFTLAADRRHLFGWPMTRNNARIIAKYLREAGWSEVTALRQELAASKARLHPGDPGAAAPFGAAAWHTSQRKAPARSSLPGLGGPLLGGWGTGVQGPLPDKCDRTAGVPYPPADGGAGHGDVGSQAPTEGHPGRLAQGSVAPRKPSSGLG
jgi:hypothetical protein